MKNSVLISSFLLLMVQANAQRLLLNLDAGVSNYSGDLQGKRYTFSQAKFQGGLGLGYELSPHITLRTGISLAKVAADDKYSNNSVTRLRNLNFTSNVFEWQLAGEYMLFDLAERRLSPYVFGGIAIFHMNPYTNDTSGNKVYLNPLGTEGQGLSEYPGKKPYDLTQFVIPLGGGVKFALSENVYVGLELGIRKTFTDYLDDVSTTYADQELLTAARGSKAAELAWRTNELPNHTTDIYPVAGAQRGSSKNKDWYYFTSIRINIRLGGGNYTTKMHGIGCPKMPR